MKIGDRMKSYEEVSESKLFNSLPILVRCDGRAFHSFTNNLTKPYDNSFSKMMIATTVALVEETDALLGYTQSDEISLLFYPKTDKEQVFFNGRRDKLVSVLASIATLAFYHQQCLFNINVARKAHFDCRAFNTPTKMEAYNYFLWREQDATKNSISMAAQSVYSHHELHKKNSSQKQDMLFEREINWNDYPSFFKRGTYVQRVKELKKFTSFEIEDLPDNHEARKNPDLEFYRSSVKIVETPPLSKVANKLEFIFGEEAPREIKDEQL